ncbi:MAG TPA: hypothetical protein VFS88_09140 [Micavibrio sp.]|nr:hypothetical protein [Micavibrio sp.]
MSDQKWSSIRVLEKPLSVIFFYESGDAKGAKIDDLFESETEWKNHLEGGSKPDSPEPFFTRTETVAARRLLCDMGILLG